MLHNLERTRAAMRNSISRTSTILAEECQLTLTEDDFLVTKQKMDKIDQRLDRLYQNWQAELKEAVTLEECKEIRRFYKPYLEKYQSKYRILYQMLQQANKEQVSLLSTQEPTLGITPSLVVLDDAPPLRQNEWKRGEPGEDMPQQYSTISGHLTPTPPKHDDMRMDSTLNITTEGSLDDLPAAVGGIEETREGTHQIPEDKRGPSSNVITSTEETPETHLKVVTERNLTQVESPRRIQRTREASREDTIALTRHFFASVNGQNRTTMTELPAETTTDVSGGNNLNIPVTSATPIVTEAETTEAETRSPRTFLPNGSPF